MSDHDKQPDFPQFAANASWFHVFHEMVKSGEVAEMQPGAVVVYLVLKSFTGLDDGRAFPELKTIAKYSGMSLASVKRHIDDLIKRGYVTKAAGRHRNEYRLREKITMTDVITGERAVATWDYVGMGVKKATDELKRLAITGQFGNAQIINIERLQMYVGDNGTQNNVDLGRLTKAERIALAKQLVDEMKKANDGI